MEVELTSLIEKLDLDQPISNDSIMMRGSHFEAFNRRFENTFKFSPAKIDVKRKLIEAIYNLLLASSNKLKWATSSRAAPSSEAAASNEHHTKLICSCLDTLRLLSRDTDGIEVFEHDDLLALVQRIANLTMDDSNIIQIFTPSMATKNGSGTNNDQDQEQEDDKQSSSPSSSPFTQSSDLLNQDIIVVAGLKSISNIIYNSKYAQDFYARNGLAETITVHLKQFTPESIREANTSPTRVNIMIFNLRIMFLLTTFNKELRQKLREKLQVITYLIEIIDQIMKERLGNNVIDDSQQQQSSVSINLNDGDHGQAQFGCLIDEQNEQADYCYLKKSDIDYIIEILKILYNLTMDTPSVRANAIATMTSMPNYQAPAKSANTEEEEAHLMHLVSVLRDLMTCKEETPEGDQTLNSSSSNNFAQISKINDLHSNIINLLTNMPTICFEELMTPCLNVGPTLSDEHLLKMVSPALKSSAYLSSDNINVRLAHNRKRISRRSRRIKKQQQQQDSSSSSPKEKPASTSGSGGVKHQHSLSSKKSFERKKTQETDETEFLVGEEDFEFEGKNMEAIAMILSFMNRNVTIYLKKPAGYNADQLYPVLLLLSLMSKANATIRRYCKYKVLPPLGKEIVNLPHEGNSIRNRLVRLMTDANIQIKRLSAQFLFILCKENVTRLVKYTGYGNAAGLLAEAGLMLSKHGDRGAYSSDSDDSDTDEYKKLEEHVNPITGRAEPDAEAKKREIFEGMSEEQKEYEALQIVKTIDKLTRMGSSGLIRPAAIGPDGKPVEIEHVLQLQANSLNQQKLKSNKNDDDDSD